MILYHGSNCEFDEIDLMRSKPGKDFGRGFYLSADREQAVEMAKIKVDQMESGTPTVMAYEVDDDKMNSLQVLGFDDYSEEWAKFILMSRNNSTTKPARDYDIVIGPIANDRVGVQLWRFENNDIDLPTLVRNLRYMKGLTIQYFFGTEKAVKLLKRI